MDILIIREWLLVMHLCGLVLMAGTTLTEFVVFRTFIRLFKIEDKALMGLLKLLSGLETLLLAGAVLLVVSGIGLILVTGGVFLHQLWLQLKLMLILLLPLNGMLVGGRQMKKLTNSLSAQSMDTTLNIQSAITKLNTFYMVQLVVFLAIVVLAVFKLN